MHCKTPEPSPTFERQELRGISRYLKLRNELDKVITQNVDGKYTNFIINISFLLKKIILFYLIYVTLI